MRDPRLAFHVLLVAVLALVAWLVRPFADAVLMALVVTILLAPLHKRVVKAVGGRRFVAATISVLGVTVGAVVPGAALVVVVSRELSQLTTLLISALDQGAVDGALVDLQSVPLASWIIAHLGGPDALSGAMQTGAADALTTIASGAGQLVPDLVGLTALAGLKVIIFYLTLMALFQHGHRLAEWLVRITPLEQAVTRQLGAVFSEFARNVVLAGIAAAVVQGIVAGIGYALAGVERVLLFALLTGVMAFVPVVGTAVAWIPVCLLLLFNHRPGAALFVAVWSLVLTGTIDNIVKPLVVRGKSDLPTLLVFLGVFGGLIAFGLIGLLVGPVLVAMLLALLHIYEEGLAAPTPEPEP